LFIPLRGNRCSIIHPVIPNNVAVH
jgi:hypothetical protein